MDVMWQNKSRDLRGLVLYFQTPSGTGFVTMRNEEATLTLHCECYTNSINTLVTYSETIDCKHSKYIKMRTIGLTIVEKISV